MLTGFFQGHLIFFLLFYCEVIVMTLQIGFWFISAILIAFYTGFYYYWFVVFKMNDGGGGKIHFTLSSLQTNIIVSVYDLV